MPTRIVFAALLLVLVAGCAANDPTQTTAPAAASASASVPPSASPLPSASVPDDLPVPIPGKPAAGNTQTITGTVSEGVEPNCLLLTAPDGGSHLLLFEDPAKRAEATVGKKVTLVGRPAPTMMSTCQQGVPFIVASVTAG